MLCLVLKSDGCSLILDICGFCLPYGCCVRVFLLGDAKRASIFGQSSYRIFEYVCCAGLNLFGVWTFLKSLTAYDAQNSANQCAAP